MNVFAENGVGVQSLTLDRLFPDRDGCGEANLSSGSFFEC